MNLLIARPDELDSEHCLRLKGRRLEHLNTVLKIQPGDSVRIGELNGAMGKGLVRSIDSEVAIIDVSLDTSPPPPLPLTVILALPRPKMLRRILRGLAETGVKNIYLVNSYRVEKSYWQSPLLQTQALHNALLAGLEQAMDTVMPKVSLRKRFRPFVEDELPLLCRGRDALLADLGAVDSYPNVPGAPGLLLIGPEGGFIAFERELIERAGARPVGLGPRMLRVETALHCALGRHLTDSQAEISPMRS